MKTRIVLSALVIATLVSGGELYGCGDKIVTFTRGTRYQHAKSRRPAAILIYASATSELPKTLANLPVDATLRKAGYRPTIVTSAEQFEKALRDGGWDLILVDATESQAVRSRVQGDKSPVVLTVLHNPSKTEWKQAKKEHAAVMKVPTKQDSFLESVDEALSTKSKP